MIEGTGPMRCCFAVLLFFVLPANAGERIRPVGVRVINAQGKLQPEDRYGDAVGNVEVIFSNGRKEVWTTSWRCELAKVSKSGLVGWTYAAGRHSRGPWMNNELCIARSKRDITHFQADRAFIEIWDFVDNNTCVVIRSRNIH